MMKISMVSIGVSCLVFVIAIQAIFPVSSALQVGFYKHSNTCVNAESIVKGVVQSFLKKDIGMGAGLIRLFFHDCFVRGSDASVLLNTSTSNPDPERFAPPNNNSLRGFEVIDAAKAALEKNCTGVVSCADIIAFAARDAAFIVSNGKISYTIPSGRFDGRISRGSEASQFLPGPNSDIATLNASFKAVGLNISDMAVLSGAHSIGRAHCKFVTGRLYPNVDSDMNSTFGSALRKNCSRNPPPDSVVNQDNVTSNILDIQYYNNVVSKKGLFTSDESLLKSAETANLVDDYRKILGLFEQKFGEAMVKMGNLGVLGKNQGEIRKLCSRVN